jgi:hypothetical protein
VLSASGRLATSSWDRVGKPYWLPRQAMRELDLPEPPTFQPLWPPPAPGSAGAAGASVSGLAPRERLAAAAQAIPGAGPATVVWHAGRRLGARGCG